jgi:hypothetical protein
MRIDPPSDDEKTALRRALLAAARECGIDPNKPLALALFVTRAGIVAHEFVNDLVRSDRHRHRLTYQEIGTAFGITMQSAHHRFRNRRR